MFKEMYNYELTLKLWTRMSDNANTNTINKNNDNNDNKLFSL